MPKPIEMRGPRWRLLGVEFHRRWREGNTYLDRMRGNHMLSHWGWITFEWARGPHVEYFRSLRRDVA